MKMNQQNFDVNKLSVAKPCSMSWENMSGDEKTRLCNACDMNIYNLSEMTSHEITSLIQNREGRLCGRIYKRTDGTVMTKDCPVGLRAYRKKISRFAGASFTAILSLFSVSFGQTEDKKVDKNKDATITQTVNKDNKNSVKGIVTDPNGAIIPNAKIIIRKKNSKFKKKTKSSDEGNFEIKKIPSGEYELEIKAEYFKPYKNSKIVITENKTVELNVELEVEDVTVTVGIFVTEPLIDMTESGITHKISGDMLRKLPINE